MSTSMRLYACVVLSVLSGGAYSAETVTCFNDHSTEKLIGVWTYEGYTDWRTARKEPRGTFVFAFLPGRQEHQVSDLHYCFFMPLPKTGEIIKCGLGSVRIARIDAPHALSGTYRFALVNGDVKALTFDASYCPPGNL